MDMSKCVFMSKIIMNIVLYGNSNFRTYNFVILYSCFFILLILRSKWFHIRRMQNNCNIWMNRTVNCTIHHRFCLNLDSPIESYCFSWILNPITNRIVNRAIFTTMGLENKETKRKGNRKMSGVGDCDSLAVLHDHISTCLLEILANSSIE